MHHSLPPMRRADRAQNNDDFTLRVLDTATELYVAFITPTEQQAPYVIPFNFVRIEKKLYIHSALEGFKMQCIKANNNVGFCATVDIAVLAEKATTTYACVSGMGSVHLVEDLAEKDMALCAIATRYAAHCPTPTSAKSLARTAVWYINIEAMSGKCNLKADG